MTAPDWSQQPHPGQQPAGGWQQPAPGHWGQPGPWGPGGPAGPARSAAGSTPLLVLGLVTALLLLLGTLLPSYDYPDASGSYSPLQVRFGDVTQFQIGGLVLLLGVVVLVVGALLLRARTAVGTGLVLVGASIALQQGVGFLLYQLQDAVTGGSGIEIQVGGVLLGTCGLVATATVVVGLVLLGRLGARSGR